MCLTYAILSFYVVKKLNHNRHNRNIEFHIGAKIKKHNKI